MEREWRTDPFEVSAINGYLYGRGVSDNKVQLRCICRYFYYHTCMRMSCLLWTPSSEVWSFQGPILAAVYAVKEMQEVGKELAFNVSFVFEGEEENGSKVRLA